MKQSTPQSAVGRILLWTFGILGILIVVLMIASGETVTHTPEISPNQADSPQVAMTSTREVSSDQDYSDTRLSDKGLYRISYVASNDIIPINQMHQWTLHVETADGQPVEDATITVDGDMPAHGHGLPTSPQVTEYLGGGDYLVEGMKFQMGGRWVMDFTVTANNQSDVVHFELMLR
jgi:hypothetical protein